MLLMEKRYGVQLILVARGTSKGLITTGFSFRSSNGQDSLEFTLKKTAKMVISLLSFASSKTTAPGMRREEDSYYLAFLYEYRVI